MANLSISTATRAGLAKYPVTFDKCVEICDQDSACRLLNYDRQYQACYTASVIDRDGITPLAGNDVVLLLD